ncbi:unnamed protein product [Boreogadus saida]
MFAYSLQVKQHPALQLPLVKHNLAIYQHPSLQLPPVKHNLEIYQHPSLQLPPVKHNLEIYQHPSLQLPPVKHSLQKVGVHYMLQLQSESAAMLPGVFIGDGLGGYFYSTPEKDFEKSYTSSGAVQFNLLF